MTDATVLRIIEHARKNVYAHLEKNESYFVTYSEIKIAVEDSTVWNKLNSHQKRMVRVFVNEIRNFCEEKQNAPHKNSQASSFNS